MRRMPLGRVVFSLAVAAALSLGGALHAQEILLEDDFSSLDPSLKNEGIVSIDDNVLTIKLTKEHWWDPIYQAMLFENADINVKVRLGDPTAETSSMAGVVFWGLNADEFYVLQFSDSGTYSVAHATPERWTYPITWRDAEGLKTEPDEWNDLRIVTVGRRATVYINGNEAGSFKGRPPAGGGVVGYFAQMGSEDGQADFSALKIVEPPASAIGAEPEDPDMILSDDFTVFDPGWGSETGWFGVKDGHLFIQFDAQQTYNALYQSEAFADIDAAVKVKLVDGKDDAYCGGAITFWATDTSTDFWQFELFDSGQFGVFRRVKDRWVTALALQPAPEAAKFDPAGENELRVVTEGRKATFYINGVEAGTIMGQPPKDNWFFGLFGESGDAAVTHEFTDLVVKDPTP
jgi:hypothetical protein